MAIFRSFSEIVNSIIERLKLTQPNLDTKPGTVARDLFIDIQADQLQRLHGYLLAVAEKQSPDVASGRDLDRWANNFGIIRRPAASAGGIVVFTVPQLTSDISLPQGSLVTSRSDQQFATIGSYVFSVSEKNRYSATANRLRNALNIAGINDAYALEVPVKALNPGTSGNISPYQIYQHNLKESINVTNLRSFNGATNSESDASFRARVFSVFSGSNVGTSFGYKSAALSTPGVNDAIVIGPGNTLMLRDGTETIQVNDGSFRIFDSGTGGKVDLYILGKQLEEVKESYIYIDKSGMGDPSDDRNDYILGQSGVDLTLTQEERRVMAFEEGFVPLQPADTIVSVIGSSSGILSQKSVDANGVVSGNYELIKDTNVDTGGSPFGFDKIRFISDVKTVNQESITKRDLNSIDPLRYSGTKNINNVYQDLSIVNENSKVSPINKSYIILNHRPVTNVSKVLNKTTGESYVITSQNISTTTGLNESGQISISGKTLPSPSDVLAVNYIWRNIFDPYVDYNGKYTGAQFLNKSVANSIDWGVPNGISGETGTVVDDGDSFKITISNNISRVTSVYAAEVETSLVISSDKTIEVAEVIFNVSSVKNSDGVELYNTLKHDGSFSGKIINLPTDSAAITGEAVTVIYNRKEYFDIQNTDASWSNNIITLPSQDVLAAQGKLTEVNDLVDIDDGVFIDYVAEITNILPTTSLGEIPINGSSGANVLLNNSLATIAGSNQPIYYTYVDSEPDGIIKFGPTRLAITFSGITRPGKIKINGETFKRLELDINYGQYVSGLTFNMDSAIRSALGLQTLPPTIGIARVDSIISLSDSNKTFDIIGHKISNNIYGLGVSDLDSNLTPTKFTIPNTQNNSSLSISSAEVLRVNLIIYNSADSEEIYAASNYKIYTDKIYSRISRIFIASGFRSPAGSIIGSIRIEAYNQPGVGNTYFSDYTFRAPIEGERLTIRYNINRLITDVTRNLEEVRPVTADVLVKEAQLLSIDVNGEIVINNDFIAEKETVVENVKNAVVNLLNTGTLGTTIDYSDVINAATGISGVDSVNISTFNESGFAGRRNYIKALDNQSIVAGIVTFNIVSRKNFKIT